MIGDPITRAINAFEGVVEAPLLVRIRELEAALASEKQCALLNAERHTRRVRDLEDMLEVEVEARREAEGEAERLRIAFHDAVRRPLGVTPDSGAEFYDPRMADEAEARRPRHSPVAPS